MHTRTIIHVGLALILLGIVAFTYQGGNDPSREKAVGSGPVQVSVDTKMPMPISPLLGAIVLVGGIVLVAVGIKKSS